MTWTQEKRDRFRQMWAEHEAPETIAVEFEIKVEQVMRWANNLGLHKRRPGRPRSVLDTSPIAELSLAHRQVLAGDAEVYLATAATVRRITVVELLERLLLTVTRDQLVDAILDDADTVGAPVAPSPRPGARDCVSTAGAGPTNNRSGH